MENIVKTDKMGTRNWIVANLLIIIPIVNIVMLFIWGYGKNSNANITKQNWAKASLVWIGISTFLLVLFGVFVLIGQIISDKF